MSIVKIESTYDTVLDLSRVICDTLFCNHNPNLVTITSLPDGLRELICNHNIALTSLPKLPNGLRELDCIRNALTSLPTLPNTDAAKQWDGWGTALKPAHEPMVLARKPLVGTVAANVLTYGTGGLNIDGSRVNPGEKIQGGGNGKASKGASWGGDGDDSIIREKVEPHTLGRWPANVIHDGSDEVVALFPDTKSGNGVKNTRQSSGNLFSAHTPTDDFFTGDSGSAARFFYCAKASKRDRNEGLDGFEAKNNGKMMRNANNTSEEPSVGFERFATEPSANHHPTVKPTDLMRYLCRLITPRNGTVLDPFMGSGSTGKAAMYEGFKFIGVEMTDEYLPIAKARIEFAVSDNEGFLL